MAESQIAQSENLEAVAGDVNEVKEMMSKLLTERDLTDQQKEEVGDESKKAERPHRERLNNKYELGHVLLHIEGTECTYSVPHDMRRNLDWLSAEVVSVTEDEVIYRPPYFQGGGLVISGFKTSISRSPGEENVLIIAGPLFMIAEVLEVNNDTTIVAIGLTEKAENIKKGRSQ